MADKEYLDAVDRVCLDCAFGEDTCPTCPVRKTVDLNKMNEKESALINYILREIHSCPFPDENGVDFDKCTGFDSDGCVLCIYRNAEKLLKGGQADG